MHDRKLKISFIIYNSENYQTYSIYLENLREFWISEKWIFRICIFLFFEHKDIACIFQFQSMLLIIVRYE